MRADGNLTGQFAIPEDFHAAGRTIREAGFADSGFIHAGTIFQLVEVFKIDRDITCRVTRIIESALWNTADEGHLPAFEADSDRTARARGLPFATATAGLAVAAGFALTEPFAAMLRAGTRFKIV